jgi:hypothetical protein
MNTNCSWEASKKSNKQRGAERLPVLFKQGDKIMKSNEYTQACLDRLIPQLRGLTITGGVVDDSGEYWGFTAKGRQNGKTIEKTVFVTADPEGNGPGFLEINDGEKAEPPAQPGPWGCVRETAGAEDGAVPATLRKPLFSLGQIVSTPGALEALEANSQTPADVIGRHLLGDWGDLCEEDRLANEEALEQGLRLLSAYRLEDGAKLWIITESDRSSTCVLLPSEY